MRVNLHEWNEFIAQNPDAHILQSGPWGELKSAFGWKPVRLIVDGCGAQLLFRRLLGGLSIGYVPKGPIGSSPVLFTEMDRVCKEEKAVFLKVEPDLWETSTSTFTFPQSGWSKTKPFQPQRTVVVSLGGTQEQLLDRMKQKTRYNIRLAEKKDVKVQISEDVATFHQMSEITAKRDGFGVHSGAYYQKVLDLFRENGQAALLMAYYQETPLAGLIVMKQGERACYMYGASANTERNRMPTYLIQFEAMKWAQSKGCTQYDLWGIPDVEEEKLEEEFTNRQSHEGLWGVYRFKRGFGGEVMRSVGAWDKVYSPVFYFLYQMAMRFRGRNEA